MNPNWKVQPLNYSDLEPNTRYRFAEIEIAKAIPILVQFEDRKQYVNSANVAARIFRRIQQSNWIPEYEEEFVAATQTYSFRTPRKEEIGIMFRYRNISYKNIRIATHMSPNTISNLHMASPFFYPVYSRWDEYMLAQWDDIKRGLNLWNETLNHMK
jgi:hypothetical protein